MGRCRRLGRSRRRRRRPHVPADRRAARCGASSSTRSSPGHAAALGEHGSAPEADACRDGPRHPRARGAAQSDGAAPDPAAIFTMVQRLMKEGDARSSHTGTGLCPDDAPARCSRAWLRAVESARRRDGAARSCCRATTSSTPTSTGGRSASTERKLALAVEQVAAVTPGSADLAATAGTLFDAARPAIPYPRGCRLPRPREGPALARRRRRAAARCARRRRRRRHARRGAQLDELRDRVPRSSRSPRAPTATLTAA